MLTKSLHVDAAMSEECIAHNTLCNPPRKSPTMIWYDPTLLHGLALCWSYMNGEATESDSVAKHTADPAGAHPHAKNSSAQGPGGPWGAAGGGATAVFPKGVGAGWVRSLLCNRV